MNDSENFNDNSDPTENSVIKEIIETKQQRPKSRGRPKKNQPVDKMLDFVVDFYCMDKKDGECTHDVTLTYENNRIKSKVLNSGIIIKLYEYKNKQIPEHFTQYLSLYTKDERNEINEINDN